MSVADLLQLAKVSGEEEDQDSSSGSNNNETLVVSRNPVPAAGKSDPLFNKSIASYQNEATTAFSIVKKDHQSKIKKCFLALKKKVSRKKGASNSLEALEPPQSAFQLPTNFAKMAENEPQRFVDFLNSQMIGRNLLIETAFGQKLKLYCDYTASGQELRFMVDIFVKVLDYYANTHTETSATGAYMNSLLNDAETEILRTMKASPEDYFVMGGGSGSTFAIEMAQKYLGTYLPPTTREQILKAFNKPWEEVKDELRSKKQLPLVIVSHYEHHSNEVTWRHQLCDVIVCPPRVDGHVDLDRLETILRRNQPERARIIGSFSAGSNVTGMKTDIVAIATLLKTYGALAFFDYAAVGPYLAIDLSLKTKDGRCLIDGVYASPHKFLGGPGSCGVLIFNRACYNSELEPSHGGGGTVDFVNRYGELFTEDPAHREKSGTPGILQIIKAGLAFHLKAILQPIIDQRESDLLRKFLATASQIKNLRILGSLNEKDRVCIISFLALHNDGPKGNRFLHQNLVVKLLNDLFGIQGRSGCSCAGPYAHYLLNISDEASERGRFWVEKHPNLNDYTQLTGFKPGWARVNLHFTFTDYEFDYLIFAIKFICENGHRFLPIYHFDPVNGQWLHKGVLSNKKPNHHLPSKFGIEALLKDERSYAPNSSDSERKAIFDEQKTDAEKLLKKLPKSKDLDSLSEMPYCFFYAEHGNVINRKLIKQKSAIFEAYCAKKELRNETTSQKNNCKNHSMSC